MPIEQQLFSNGPSGLGERSLIKPSLRIVKINKSAKAQSSWTLFEKLRNKQTSISDNSI